MIEELDLRGGPRLRQKDHALGPRPEVRRSDSFAREPLTREPLSRENVERDRAETESRCATEEVAPGRE